MNAMVRLFAALCVVLWLAASAGSALPQQRSGPKLLVTGKVDGRTGELVSPDLGRFRIMPENQGDELLQHPGEIVTVEGFVMETDDGAKLLYVDVWKQVGGGSP